MARKSSTHPPDLEDYTVRTTVVLPIAVDRNLEIYCAKTGLGKSEVIRGLLQKLLREEGLNPDKTPTHVEYAVSY